MSDASTAAPATEGEPATPATDPAAPGDPAAPADPAAPSAEDKGLLGRDEPAQVADPNALPEWMNDLPDDLKGDKTLAKYGSLEDQLRGHLEAHKVAKGKVTLPKDDDPESFARFAAAVRPEDPASYKIEVPEGDDTGFADAMRGTFHEAGLHPAQVEMLVGANNKFVADARAALESKGQAEMDALEADMGATEFQRGMQAATNMLNKLGIKPDFENNMERMIGSGNTLRTLFALAEKTGELGRVDGNDVQLALGTLTGDAAKKAAQAMLGDPETARKVETAGTPERARYDALVKSAAKKG